MSGESFIIKILFVIAGILAFGYMVGYRTKFCAILSWVFLASLQNRNTGILHGGDDYLIALLFWSLFLPIGSKWAIDAMIKKEDRDAKSFVSFGSLAMIVQIVSLYVFAGLLKNDPIWTTEFTAVYYALNIEQFTTPLGLELLNYQGLMKLLTMMTLYLEKYGALIFFIPWFTSYFRIFGVLSFLIFHLFGLKFTMELGLFPYVCAVAVFVFIPGWFWNKMIPTSKPLLAKFLDYSSKVNFLNDLKNIIANVLDKKKQANEIVTPYDSKERIIDLKKVGYQIGQGLVCFLMINTFFGNLSRVDDKFRYLLQGPARLLRIEQHWSLFAPRPLAEDGWYVLAATLNNCAQVDLFRGGKAINYSKPDLISAQYPSARWRKYMMNLSSSHYSEHRPHYLKYMCSEWNKKHAIEENFESVEMVFMLKNTPLPGHPKPAPIRTSLCIYEP